MQPLLDSVHIEVGWMAEKEILFIHELRCE